MQGSGLKMLTKVMLQLIMKVIKVKHTDRLRARPGLREGD